MEPARGSAATTVTGRFRQWLAGWGLKEWRRAALVTVLVATAAFGGLDTVNKQVTDLKVGEKFDTGRFQMTVQRATLLDEVRAGERVVIDKMPGRRFVALVVTVHNSSTLPGFMNKPVELFGLPDSEPHPVMRWADGTLTGALGPGLTDQVVLLWDVPATAISVGDELRVRIWKEVTRLKATYGQGWVQSMTNYGLLTVPVRLPR
jgi:hypothetical protein